MYIVLFISVFIMSLDGKWSGNFVSPIASSLPEVRDAMSLPWRMASSIAVVSVEALLHCRSAGRPWPPHCLVPTGAAAGAVPVTAAGAVEEGAGEGGELLHDGGGGGRAGIASSRLRTVAPATAAAAREQGQPLTFDPRASSPLPPSLPSHLRPPHPSLVGCSSRRNWGAASRESAPSPFRGC